MQVLHFVFSDGVHWAGTIFLLVLPLESFGYGIGRGIRSRRGE